SRRRALLAAIRPGGRDESADYVTETRPQSLRCVTFCARRRAVRACGMLEEFTDGVAMQLAELATASAALAATGSRLAKVALLCDSLRKLGPEERIAGAAWLAGTLPGGRIGLGPAAVRELRNIPPAPTPSLTVAEAARRIE